MKRSLVLLWFLPISAIATSISSCYPLNTTNVCGHLTDNCDQSIYKYATYFYCSTASQASHFVVFGALSIILTVLFLGLGITASDFLYPNLNTLSNFLGLDQRVAGMTLLALGNSTPDIFSTYSAMASDSTSLAIGELIGAALLVVSVVIGSMAIINPFQVNKIDFMRDLIFFTLLISISLLFIIDGKLTLTECGLMIILYFIYVFCLLFFHNQETDTDIENGLQSETAVTINSIIEENNSIHSDNNQLSPIMNTLKKSNSYNGRISPANLLSPMISPVPLSVRNSESMDYLYSPTSPNMVRFSVHDVLKVWSMNESPTPLNNHHHKTYSVDSNIPSILISNMDLEPLPTQFYNSKFSSSTIPKPPKPIKSLSLNNINTYTSMHAPQPVAPKNLRIITDINDNEHNNPSAISSVKFPEEEIKGSASIFDNLLTEVQNLKNPLRIYSFMLTLFSLPIMILLTLTIPVSTSTPTQPEPIDIKLQYIQLFLIPFIINYVSSIMENRYVLPISICLVGIWYTQSHKITRFQDTTLTVYHTTQSLIGFTLSLLWISIFSNKIIIILKNIGLILNISESLLGLTLFAIGNSIGDLISNITLSKIGLSVTGFGACFGAPLLYILLGIGFNGCLIILNASSGVVEFEVNLNLIISGIGLLIILVFYLVVIPLNGWTFNSKIGIIGIAWWCFITVINCFVDYYIY